MSNELSQNELLSKLSVPRYAPRLNALPIPGARWNDEPLYCLQVNDEWVSHLLGVMIALDQPDTWQGNDEDIYDARQQVNEIMLAFMEVCDPMNNCCPEPNRSRYTDDGLHYEISYDGGETWVDGSDFDPRVTSPQYPPIAGTDGNAKKCDAANSVLVQIKDKVSAWEGMLSTAGTLAEFGLAAITALVVGIFAPAAVPLIFGACIAIIKTCWDAGEEAYSAAFNDTVYDDLLCIIYCAVESDGTFTDGGISQILEDCASHFDVIPRDAFRAAFTGWGVVGTINAATLGGGGEECDDCECDDETCVETFEVYSPDPNGYYGNITNVNAEEGWLEIETTNINTNSLYYISIQTDADDHCCVYSGADNLIGAPDSPAWANCGGSRTSFSSGIIGTSRCVNAIQATSASPFKVRYYFSPCP